MRNATLRRIGCVGSPLKPRLVFCLAIAIGLMVSLGILLKDADAQQCGSQTTCSELLLPDLLPGRGSGEVPLRQVFSRTVSPNTFNTAFQVKISGGVIYRQGSGCNQGPDGTCVLVEDLPFTSADQDPDAVKAICGDIGAETLYVLGPDLRFYFVDACKGVPGNPNSRAVLMWDGIRYTNPQVSDPGYTTKNPQALKVVHASILAENLGSKLYDLVSSVYGAGIVQVQNGVLKLLTIAAAILNHRYRT